MPGIIKFKDLIAVSLCWSVLAGCNAVHSEPSRLADKSPDESFFSASDVSILVPLKPFKPTTPQDPFKIEGDGMCNAPGLDLGGTDPIMNRDTFLAISAEAFGKINLINTVEGSASPISNDTVAAINQELMQASAHCGSAFVPTLLSQFADAELLKVSSHLALIKGINPDVCLYENWRVVGFRFDPCLDRVAIPDFDKATSLPAECKINEARLVVQPFVKSTNGNYNPIDVTMHLIYRIPDMTRLLTDLKEMQLTTQVALTQSPWGSPEDNHPRMLRPHPGLRSEMGCQEGQARPVGSAFQKLLINNTKQSLLQSIAFMTSSASTGQWSFGVREIRNGIVEKRSFDRFESFSLKQHSLGKNPFNIDPKARNTILPFFERSLSQDDLLEFSGVVNDIVNPKKVSQVVDDPEKTSTCTSCHLPEFTLGQVGSRLAQAQFLGIRPYTRSDFANALENTAPPVWRPFKFSKKSNIQNLRNFGYGPSFTFGVSQRTLNETDELLATLKRIYQQ